MADKCACGSRIGLWQWRLHQSVTEHRPETSLHPEVMRQHTQRAPKHQPVEASRRANDSARVPV
jgi:hypothetical protein